MCAPAWGTAQVRVGLSGFARKDASCLSDFLITAGFNSFPTPKGAVVFVLLLMP